MGMVPNVNTRATPGMQTSNSHREPGVCSFPRGRWDRVPIVSLSAIPEGKPQYCFLYSNQAARSAEVTCGRGLERGDARGGAVCVHRAGSERHRSCPHHMRSG
eukprot:scaffold17742_cov101-Isochrysis_galbana.AAC.1